MRISRAELLVACLKRIEEMSDLLRSRDLIGLGLWNAEQGAYIERMNPRTTLPFQRKGRDVYYKKSDVIQYVKKYGVLHPVDESKFEISKSEKKRISDLLSLLVRDVFPNELANDIGIAENTLLGAIAMDRAQHPRTYHLLRKYLEKNN